MNISGASAGPTPNTIFCRVSDSLHRVHSPRSSRITGRVRAGPAGASTSTATSTARAATADGAGVAAASRTGTLAAAGRAVRAPGAA